MPNIRLNRRALVKLRGGSRKLPWEKLLRCVLGKPEFGNVMKGVWWGEGGTTCCCYQGRGCLAFWKAEEVSNFAMSP